jgi:hypothetical protein
LPNTFGGRKFGSFCHNNQRLGGKLIKIVANCFSDFLP